jgi:NAD kinase
VNAFDKIVLITQRTDLEELIERFNTRDQARFYIQHMGGSFDSYQEAHNTYHASLKGLNEALPKGVRHQVVGREFLPNFLFGERDLVVTLGRDGLVVNTAKYLSNQPLVGINPDPRRIDGVLLPFTVKSAAEKLGRMLKEAYSLKNITMAKVTLNDGQALYGVNDLFIGPKSHTSARYYLESPQGSEEQSSSGLIVSTGAGSTGWYRSILTGAVGVVGAFNNSKDLRKIREEYAFDWEANYLRFSVREPFISNTSRADICFGQIEEGESLVLTSRMPRNGVIFSDGIEDDYLQFNSGSIATITVAEKKVRLVVRG